MRGFSLQSLLATLVSLLFFLEAANAQKCADYYLYQVGGKGVAPFAPANYKTFRNVKDYGAKGDGKTDDTAAINRAISDNGRCGPGCTGSTKEPATIFFPSGTYIVSAPIIDYYYTILHGNPIPGCMATLKATPGFSARWLLDSNPYGANGLAWGATNVFWRQVNNLVIDLTAIPATREVAGIHWPSSQATSISNVVFKMAQGTNSKHEGIFMEEGSGGYLGDLVFHGGGNGMTVGNQQFTMRNLTFWNAQTAIKQLWSWGWTYQGVSINNCKVGFDFTAVDGSALAVGSVVIVDSQINNTPVGITFGNTAGTGPATPNNLMVENLALNNVPTAIRGPTGTVLAGSTGRTTVAAWGRGNEYTKNTGPVKFQKVLTPNNRPASLLRNGKYYALSKPTYEKVLKSGFVTARGAGAKGDGKADDTAAINNLLASAAAAKKVVHFDAGIYRVTNTIKIPPGSRITGESWPIIMSSGANFNNMNSPRPVVQIGNPGQAGSIEWSNMIVSTQGAQAGAILIQYNLNSGSANPSGMWDVHVRIGGFAGSNIQLAQCAKTPGKVATKDNISPGCISGFLSMHITKQSSGLLMENCWLWVADHDMEMPANNQQITVYTGRGLLIESTAGNIWLYGTGVEHHQQYEYHLVGTKNIVMGQIQTETAYYQPNPDALIPFPFTSTYNDVTIDKGQSGWGLRIFKSSDVLVYGAGLYSFFKNNDNNCAQVGQGHSCQTRIFSVKDSSRVSVYNLNTVGTTKMIMYNGNDIASANKNENGFINTIALFRV
ncbi:glycoside hydrolase [Rhypophila decipiens]